MTFVVVVFFFSYYVFALLYLYLLCIGYVEFFGILD